ncbi:riboflavin synthase [bacterium]|nr:riboflavin synthase [candidate division CSSED10-310 bacterium]
MFTGIIQEVGTVQRIVAGGSRPELEIKAMMCDGLTTGESVAVNGVCLTVQSRRKDRMIASVSRETLEVTTLGMLKPGATVNLERALTMQSLLGGHLVQGHVDHVGEVAGVRRETAGWVVVVKYPREMAPFLVNKGSVAVDGVSLTVSRLAADSFQVHIIPHTWENTVMRSYRSGSRVNLEADIIGRYVQRFMEWQRDDRLPADPA